jgi:hypothetical protein
VKIFSGGRSCAPHSEVQRDLFGFAERQSEMVNLVLLKYFIVLSFQQLAVASTDKKMFSATAMSLLEWEVTQYIEGRGDR